MNQQKKKPVSFCAFGIGEKALVCVILLGGVIMGASLSVTAYGRIVKRMHRANLLSSGKEITGEILKKSMESHTRSSTDKTPSLSYSYEFRVRYTSGSMSRPFFNNVVVSEGVYNSFREGTSIKVYIDPDTPEQPAYEFLPKEIESASIAVGAVGGLLSWLVAVFLSRFIVRSYRDPQS